MKKILSDWSKEVKKAMIDRDMDMNDVAARMKWSKQHTTAIINGRTYNQEPVIRLSQFFNVAIPPANATLAKARSGAIDE